MMLRPILTSLAILLASAAASPVAGQTPPKKKLSALTPEQALTLRTLSDLRFSPDAQRLAFTVTEPPKGTGSSRHVWMLEVKTRELRQFTSSAKSEFAPRWSPDGRRLAFLSDREENRQIYWMPTDGGEATRLTEGKRDVEAFEWSPDGKQIAFLAPDAKSEAEEKKQTDKDDARVVDRDDKHARLWLLDLESGKARALTAPAWEVSEVQWTAGGDQLIVSATDHPESNRETNRIYSVDPASGKMAEIAAPLGPFRALRVSPDGKQVGYLAGRVDGPSPHDLYLQYIEGGPSRNLTGGSIDRLVGNYLWRPDGSILLRAQNGFRNFFYAVTTDGTAKPFGALEANFFNFDSGANGMIALVGYSATQPEELWLWDGHSPAERVSRFNQSWEGIALSKPEYFRYRSFDGAEIEGALLKPVGDDGKSRLPLVVLAHGGPTYAWTDRLDTWGQLLTTHGYAVFYPNVRGSTGYGEKFLESNRGEWGGGDYRDLMAGVDSLIARGIVDPERLGIGGWSYGGYMAEWAITQTRRFKAAVSGAGMANLASEFGTEVSPAYDEWFYGLPYENPTGFMRSSPITYLKNARTPTLILQGEVDRIDPPGQSEELYRGLKYYGVEAELVMYPREPHGPREQKHQLDLLNRILGWYDAHLK